MTNKPHDLTDLDKALSSKGDPYDLLEAQLGPAVREYRRKWKLAGKGRLELDYPLHLNIELLYGCNLRCEFCALSKPMQNIKNKTCRGKSISFDKYREIIDEGVAHGLASVALNGFNEPLLQQEIADYATYAATAGVVEVSLHTNAMLLTEDMSSQLLDSGLNIIMFSIDAFSKESYDQIRTGGDYETAVTNVLRFLEMKKQRRSVLPLTRTSFVMTKINYEEIEDFVAFWDEHVDYIMLQGFCNPLVGHDCYDEIEDHFRLEDQPFNTCFLPWQRLSIGADGAVMPCCSYFGLEMPVGNIYESSVHQIWSSDAMDRVRQTVNADTGSQPLSCRKCRRSAVGREYAAEALCLETV